MMSYKEYLEKTGQKDSPTAWKWWKIEVCGMSEKQAIKAYIEHYKKIKKA